MVPTRTFLLLSVLAFVIPSTAESQDINPLDQLVVLDGDNEVVGPVIALNDAFTPAVAFEVDGKLAVLQVRRDGFFGLGGDLFFESSDCTGQPLLSPATVAEIIPKGTIRPPGSTVYIPNMIDKPVNTTTNSRLFENGSCDQRTSGGDWIRALQLVDLDERFTPPFRTAPAAVEATCCGDCDADGLVGVHELVTGVRNALTGCPAPP